MSHPERNLKIEYISDKITATNLYGRTAFARRRNKSTITTIVGQNKKLSYHACRGLAKFLFASSQKCDSPLEVTRFEFTIKSCRCTKTCERCSPLHIFGIVYSSAKSLRSLRIYIALKDRKAVQI